jgi:hypothetical protein
MSQDIGDETGIQGNAVLDSASRAEQVMQQHAGELRTACARLDWRAAWEVAGVDYTGGAVMREKSLWRPRRLALTRIKHITS